MQRKRGGASSFGQTRSDLYLSNNARSFWDELACSGMIAAGLNVWEACCSEENACIGVSLCLFLWARFSSSTFYVFLSTTFVLRDDTLWSLGLRSRQSIWCLGNGKTVTCLLVA